MELKYVLPKEPLLSNVPANLLKNEPKNPPDWIILDIWDLDNFISVAILFSNTFLSLVFCLIVNNKSCGKFFLSEILIFILKVAPVCFLTAFSANLVVNLLN